MVAANGLIDFSGEVIKLLEIWFWLSIIKNIVNNVQW